MAGFRLTPQALADITDIWNYIAADNPAAAQRVVDKLQQRARRLAEHPLMGRRRIDLKPGLFSFPSGNYLIFYTYADDLVEIVRVLHGARDLAAIFQEDED